MVRRGKHCYIGRATNLGPMDQFPNQDGHDEDGNANVRGDEVGCVPVSFQEHWETSNQGDDCRSKEPEPGSIRLQRSHPGQRATTYTLRLESGIKANVTEAECRPGDQTGHGAKIQKPAESLRGAARTET